MRGRGFAVRVRGHGSGEGERPGEMGAFPSFWSAKLSWHPGVEHLQECFGDLIKAV